MARRSSSDSGGFIFKTGLFAVLAGLAFWIFNQFSGKSADPHPGLPSTSTPPIIESPEGSVRPASAGNRPPSVVPEDIFPAPSSAEVVKHTWYALGYSEDHEQAAWVAYELTRVHVEAEWNERPQTFRPDPDVRTESATPRDYAGSGYDKGHLCPAADMAFDAAALDETFLMSNMSPQVPNFNTGIWKALEERTRAWARRYGQLYVVTGPVLTQPGLGQIGFSKVTVPAAYYKVLLAPDARRAIAFVLPNAPSNHPLLDFACSIDQAEEETGLDFFPKLLTGADEALEAEVVKSAWPVK